MGPVDDDGVGIGDVDTILDDGRREQHVVVVVREVEHNLLQFLGFHLSMTNGHTGIGDMGMDHLGNMGEVADAIVHEIHLPIARHFEINGIGNDLCTKGMYLCLNGIAIGWGRLDDAQVACAHERELQGARYRRGRQRQAVDAHLHLLQFLFGADAELLLLVYDEESEVFEFQVFVEYGVGAYEYVYLAVGQVFDYLVALLGGAEAVDVVDPHGHVLEALAEGVVVLESEHRRWHEHSHLL